MRVATLVLMVCALAPSVAVAKRPPLPDHPPRIVWPEDGAVGVPTNLRVLLEVGRGGQSGVLVLDGTHTARWHGFRPVEDDDREEHPFRLGWSAPLNLAPNQEHVLVESTTQQTVRFRTGFDARDHKAHVPALPPARMCRERRTDLGVFPPGEPGCESSCLVSVSCVKRFSSWVAVDLTCGAVAWQLGVLTWAPMDRYPRENANGQHADDVPRNLYFEPDVAFVTASCSSAQVGTVLASDMVPVYASCVVAWPFDRAGQPAEALVACVVDGRLHEVMALIAQDLADRLPYPYPLLPLWEVPYRL